MVNKLKLLLPLLLLSLIAATGCTRVGPGYVGIKVNQAGSDRGVESYPIQMGWVWFNPITSDVFEYPTFKHTVTWDEDSSLQFNAKGGTRVTAPVSITFAFKPERVPHIFVSYRTTPEIIEQGYLKQQVRDAFNRAGNTFEPLELLTNQQGLLDTASKHLLDHIGQNFEVESVMLPKGVHLPENITASINNVIAAQQAAQQAQAKVAQIEAEGRQTVAAAEANAKARLVEADAEAQANQKIANSITPTLVELKRIEKWNGVTPTVTGGAQPLLQLK